MKVQKLQGGKTELKKKKISVNYEDAVNRKVTISIEGDLDKDLIEEIVDNSLKVIKTDKKDEFFQQPDYLDNSQGLEAIELKYNKKKVVWEPVNFGDIRRKMDEFQKKAEQKFKD